MRRLVWHNAFRRAFKRRARNDSVLQERIFQTLENLANDPFHPALRTHKLSGQLKGLWSCWVEYDCRVIFTFESEPQSGEEVIVLIDLGAHDEVY